jgi:hypothetical protein
VAVSKKVLLVKCDSNWADEMDLEGFALVPQDVWDEHLNLVEKRIFHKKRKHDDSGPHVVYIGTNEWVCFETFEEYAKSFSVKTLSTGQANLLSKLFDIGVSKNARYISTRYGYFLSLDTDSYQVKEEAEEEIENE